MDHVHAFASGQAASDPLHRHVQVGTASLDPAHGAVDLFGAHERPPPGLPTTRSLGGGTRFSSLMSTPVSVRQRRRKCS